MTLRCADCGVRLEEKDLPNGGVDFVDKKGSRYCADGNPHSVRASKTAHRLINGGK